MPAPRISIFMIAALALALACAAPARASRPASLALTSGKSALVDLESDAARVAVADPEVADIILLSPRQIYVTAKAPGLTNLTLWNQGGQVAGVFDVSVTPDASRLKEMLHRVLPGESNIKVMAAHDSLTLAGTVTSAASQATALELAEVYAPGKVVNLMGVGGVHQVMLEVKVAEMNRTVMERFGFDLSFFRNGTFAYSLINNLFTLDNQNGPLPVVPWQYKNSPGEASSGNMRISQSRNGMFRFRRGASVFTGFLDMLKQNGLVRILAEPTLICLSGKDASFLAGGEIPVPVPQGLGTTAIEYKPFGVALRFTPVVLDGGRISLKVFPEVSELDYANAVNVSGFTIPAITSRRAQTTVELGNGQSFAIAGLLKDNVREGIDKYPVLGDIPVLGSLFRSSQYQKDKTELVIIVTPHLAKPLDRSRQALPTDDYREPGEAEFFLMGRMEGSGSGQPGRPGPSAQAPVPGGPGRNTGPDGEFGHLPPKL